MNLTGRSPEELANETWVLVGEKAGDNDQAVELARTLDCPYRLVKLSYNPGFRIPNAILGATMWTVRDGREEIRPPWPKIVIGTGRRSVPLARFIKKSSGGRSRIVRIGRPRADLRSFDLVVTTPQYRLPSAPNVHCLPLPIASRNQQTLKTIKTGSTSGSADANSGDIVVMVGGDSDFYRFDTKAAADLGMRLQRLARQENRSVAICYGRRVQRDAADALDQSVGAYLSKSHRFSDSGENPYSSLLAQGEVFVVSTDSASMMGDAIRSGRAVFLYTAKFQPNLIYTARLRIDSFLERILGPERWAVWVARGLYVPVKRMDILVRQILHTSGVRRLGDRELCEQKRLPGVGLDAVCSTMKAWVN